MADNKSAVLLINLGTPDAPEEDAIRRYLRQFLSDPRVVDLPRWFWLALLNLVILRIRPRRLVGKYRLIWGARDGPIRNITRALAGRLQTLMPGSRVVTAMTYGRPAVAEALDSLAGYEHITVVPLFPQYAGATTGAVQDALRRALAGREARWRLDLIEDYHADPDYIAALADSVRRSKSFRGGAPMVVFSFHGIPQSQADKGDPYAGQCRTTATLTAAALALPANRWTLTYQSRFGPFAWLQPYTDATMASLPGRGVKDVLVVCPGFAVDCLETIEEIKILNRDIFLKAGGESFHYVKALNATWAHAHLQHRLVSKQRNLRDAATIRE